MRNEAGAKPCAAAPWHAGLAARPWVFGATSDFRRLKCTRRSYWGNSAQLFPAPSRDILSNTGQLKSSKSLHANGKRFDAIKKTTGKDHAVPETGETGETGGVTCSSPQPAPMQRSDRSHSQLPWQQEWVQNRHFWTLAFPSLFGKTWEKTGKKNKCIKLMWHI